MMADSNEKEIEDSQMHVLNLLEKFHSGSVDGQGTDSDSDDIREDELEKLTDYGIGGNHSAFIGCFVVNLERLWPIDTF